MINFDFWHNNTLEDVKRVDCFFSDLDCIYRGNMYDANNKIIGDYSGTDSVEIEAFTFEVWNKNR